MGPQLITAYHYLKDEEEAEGSEEIEKYNASTDSLIASNIPTLRQSVHARSQWHLAGSVAVLLMLFLTNFLTAVSVHWVGTQDGRLIKQTSSYSPFLDRVPIGLSIKKIDASIYPNVSNPDHIYRLPPSPAVDAAWDRISITGIHPITHADVVSLNKDPGLAIVAPEDWWPDSPTSSPAYMGEVDVFHQIHCLNALRKALITNYEYYWGARYGLNPPVQFSFHLDHCTNILLQNLMCHADMDAVIYNWRESEEIPYPDFGVYKKCRDFDALLRWREEAMMEDQHERFMAMEKPADAIQLPAPDGLELILNETTGWRYGNPTAPLTGLPVQCRP